MFYRINEERMLKEILKYFVKNKLNVENCGFERVKSFICIDIDMYFDLSNDN